MGFALGSFCLLLCGYRCFIRVLGEAWWAEAVLDGDRNSRFPLPPLYPSTTGCSPSSETSVCLVLHHLLPFPFKPSFPPAFSHLPAYLVSSRALDYPMWAAATSVPTFHPTTEMAGPGGERAGGRRVRREEMKRARWRWEHVCSENPPSFWAGRWCTSFPVLCPL